MLGRLKEININKKLYYILLLATVLMLIRISQVDFLGDNAHYTIRSLGYVDHMFSDQQTTPLNWFEHFPWWANLSFHDQPPLLFLVQHIFLTMRESIFFAKLPYVLFSLGTIFLLYIMLRKPYGEKMALWSALFLSINSVFLYTVRAGFMEAGVIFFVALSIYSFFKFLENKKYWWLFGASLGLCFLAKYSTFFLVPSFITYILITNRKLFQNKKLYFALGLSILMASPVIIYNLMMFQTTGHFDYQFARLFHQTRPWVASDVNGIENPIALFKNYANAVSYVYLFFAFGGIIYGLTQKKLKFISISLFFLIVFFLITGSGTNHQNLLNLFLAPALGFLAVEVSEKIKFTKFLVWIFMIYLFIFAVNSHILIKPFGQKYKGLLISSAPSVNLGMYQLDKYLNDLIKKENIKSVRDGYVELKSKNSRLKKEYGTKPEALLTKAGTYPHMIVFDDNLDWFAELWPYKRRRFFYNMPILSTEELQKFGPDITIGTTYFIKATENTALEGAIGWREFPEEFEQALLEQGFEPEDRIYRTDGKEVFKVYMINAQYESK